MATLHRLLLARHVSFAAVEEELAARGLKLARVVPLVFPGRPEPAIARFEASDGETAATFRYLVDPERRFVETSSAPVARGLEAARLTLPLSAALAMLDSELPEDARWAAIAVGEFDAELVAAGLQSALTRFADDWVAPACVQSLVHCGATSALTQLAALGGDAAAPPALRLAAQEAHRALSSARRV